MPLRQEEVGLLYIGNDKARDAEAMRYYLQRAFPETARRNVNLIARKPEEPLLTKSKPLVDWCLGSWAFPRDLSGNAGNRILVRLNGLLGGAFRSRLIGLDGG